MNETIMTFGYPATLLREYDHWMILLRPKQVTLGSLIIASKLNANSLGQLTADEWSEFAMVSKQAESVVKSLFNPNKFNYLAQMMKDPNVHFHFIPRYPIPIEFDGHTFSDVDWPLKTELDGIRVDETTMNKLLSKLKEGFAQ